MNYLVIPGALITMVGLAGLLVCIKKARKAKDMKNDPEALSALLKYLMVLNMASLFTAMFGLIMIVVGLFL